jgi:hypothetical protein
MVNAQQARHETVTDVCFECQEENALLGCLHIVTSAIKHGLSPAWGFQLKNYSPSSSVLARLGDRSVLPDRILYIVI